jgi:predicted ester cyclase
VDETFAADYKEHNPRPGQEPGIEGYKGGVSMMRAAFPDLVLDVGDVIAESDRIALRYSLRGRHDGELMGIPASGQRVSSDGMVFARFQDGRVVERWGVQDMLTLLQQIGAFPAAEAATG